MARLLALHAYLNGDLKPTLRQPPAAAAAPEAAAPDALASAAAADSSMAWEATNGGGSGGASAAAVADAGAPAERPQAAGKAEAKPQPAEPLSRCTLFCGLKPTSDTPSPDCVLV